MLESNSNKCLLQSIRLPDFSMKYGTYFAKAPSPTSHQERRAFIWYANTNKIIVWSLMVASNGNWNRSWYLVSISCSHWLPIIELGIGKNDSFWIVLWSSLRDRFIENTLDVLSFVAFDSNCTLATLPSKERNFLSSSKARWYYNSISLSSPFSMKIFGLPLQYRPFFQLYLMLSFRYPMV